MASQHNEKAYEERKPEINKIQKGIVIISNLKWYTRIWVHISNPFRYLFTGKLRY